MATGKILCLSIDLDSIACYYGLYGLPAPPEVKTIHYTKGLKRFLELFDDLNIRSTLFAVGEEMEDRACRTVLAEAAAAGHEAANHTWSHPYGLTRMPGGVIRQEIARAHRAIGEAAGREPVGFRAPGYHLSEAVMRALEGEGYLYDASLLPSPPYYLTKSAVILLASLRGRESRSIIGGPGMVISPGEPYRTGARYWLRGSGMLEIPCTVATPARIPFIGTTITLFSDRALGLLMHFLKHRSFLSIELHAIDMMDADMDGFRSLAPFQPDAAVPLATKSRRIGKALRRIVHDFGFEPMTLRRAAEILRGNGQ
jgi:peptidoglycan/xylan/chitin deacetylase (PgdA/CDA1 family)